jgi:hypothetical protein
MRRKLIAALLTAVMLLTGFSGMALAVGDKAEKLHHDNTGWDKESQAFVVTMSCKFGIATAGEHAGFTISTDLLITDGIDVFHYDNNVRGIAIVEGATKDADGYIEIEPQTIGWDRDGGSFTGQASVTVTTSLIGPGGKKVGRSTATVFEGIDIQPSNGGPPGTTEITSVCNEVICELIEPEQTTADITLLGNSVIHLESDFFSDFTDVTLDYSAMTFDITDYCKIEQYWVGLKNHVEVSFSTFDLPVGESAWARYTVELHPMPPVPEGAKLSDSIWIATSGDEAE